MINIEKYEELEAKLRSQIKAALNEVNELEYRFELATMDGVDDIDATRRYGSSFRKLNKLKMELNICIERRIKEEISLIYLL